MKNPKEFEHSSEKRNYWRLLGESLPMTLKWDELKDGMKCHIPPVLGNSRKDFIILKTYDKFLRIKMLNEKEGESPYDWFYNYDIQANFITKIK